VLCKMTSEVSEVCRNFRNTGRCRYDTNCKYEHSQGDPIPLPERVIKPRGVCFNFQQGSECKYGTRCRFFHGSEADAAVEAEQRKIRSESKTTDAPDGDRPKQRRRRRTRSQRTDGDASSPKPRGGAAPEHNAAGQEICRNFKTKGKCRFGESCKWVHEGGENTPAADATDDGKSGGRRRRRRRSQRPRGEARTCFSFQNNGSCEYADKCRFKHGDDDTRDLTTSRRAASETEGAHDAADGEGGARRRRRRSKPAGNGECFSFRDGNCERGDQCRFKHGDADTRDLEAVRAATRKPAGPCNNWTQTGACKFESKCRFSHE